MPTIDPSQIVTDSTRGSSFQASSAANRNHVTPLDDPMEPPNVQPDLLAEALERSGLTFGNPEPPLPAPRNSWKPRKLVEIPQPKPFKSATEKAKATRTRRQSKSASISQATFLQPKKSGPAFVAAPKLPAHRPAAEVWVDDVEEDEPGTFPPALYEEGPPTTSPSRLQAEQVAVTLAKTTTGGRPAAVSLFRESLVLSGMFRYNRLPPVAQRQIEQVFTDLVTDIDWLESILSGLSNVLPVMGHKKCLQIIAVLAGFKAFDRILIHGDGGID